MKIVLYILILFLTFTSIAQQYNIKLLNEQPLDADTFVGVDDFSALYYIKNNTIFKKSETNTYQFSSLQLGTIASVDIVNPLKISVFYRDSNTTIILDNTLNEITRIDFSNIDNFRNISHARTAGDRQLWVFNTDLQQLEVYDWNQNKIITQFPPQEHNATTMTSNFNFAWVVEKDEISQYNIYGSFVKKITIETPNKISQSRGDLIFVTQKGIFYKEEKTSQFTELFLPDLHHKDSFLNNEILYIYDGQKLTTFELSKS